MLARAQCMKTDSLFINSSCIHSFIHSFAKTASQSVQAKSCNRIGRSLSCTHPGTLAHTEHPLNALSTNPSLQSFLHSRLIFRSCGRSHGPKKNNNPNTVLTNASVNNLQISTKRTAAVIVQLIPGLLFAICQHT